jgi:hypothetical protein
MIILTDYLLTSNSLLETRNLLRSAGIDPDVTLILPVSSRTYRDVSDLFLDTKTAKAQGLADPDLLFQYKNKSLYPDLTLLEDTIALTQRLSQEKADNVVTMGPLALWAVTGKSSADKWRGSIIEDALIQQIVFPTHAVSRLHREYWLKRIVLRDLIRVAKYEAKPLIQPNYDFTIAPSFGETLDFLKMLLYNPPMDVAVDIETTSSHYIGCIGLAHSSACAICIPFIDENYQPYFTVEQELQIIELLCAIFLKHTIIGQNFAFDAQYLARDYGVIPPKVDDTMIAHHVCYNSLPKDLAFQTSLYQDYYVYWKDEGKFIDETKNFRQWWLYNCKDCVTTYANMQVLRKQLVAFNLTKQYESQMRKWPRIVRVMVRGVRIDQKEKLRQAMEVQEKIANLESELDQYSVLFPSTTDTPWYNSPTQLAKIFYNLLQYPTFYHKKTKQPSTDDTALAKLRKKAPLIAPLIDRILELRSLRVFYSTFLCAGVGADGRMRTSYDQAGTETYRLASRKDAFGGGLNLQNIPRNRS